MASLDFSTPGVVVVDGEAFSYGMPPRHDLVKTPPVLKTRVLIEQLHDLLNQLSPRIIVELGIHRGGSTALVAAIARPERLVAIDIDAERAELLDDFITTRRLEDVIRPFYGLDQASPGVLRTVDAEIGDAALDLVFDDASHLYEPTRKSFEMLFPRLREGGVYIIEDWAAQHTFLATIVDTIVRRAHGWQRALEQLCASVETVDGDLAAAARGNPAPELVRVAGAALGRARVDRPLSRLVVELTLMAAQTRDVIRQIVVTQGWTQISRGAGQLDDTDWFVAGTYDLFPTEPPDVGLLVTTDQ